MLNATYSLSCHLLRQIKSSYISLSQGQALAGFKPSPLNLQELFALDGVPLFPWVFDISD